MDEFDIMRYINETLKPIGIPVFFTSRKEVKPPLIVFNVTGEQGNLFWENEEQETVWKITVNIFARESFVGFKKDVLKLMKEAGFIRTDIPACIYLEDIDLYNQPINFKYYKETN